jgi:cell division control protein 24
MLIPSPASLTLP